MTLLWVKPYKLHNFSRSTWLQVLQGSSWRHQVIHSHEKAGISSSWIYTREKTHLHSLYKICQAGWSREHHLPIQPNRKAHGKLLSDIFCVLSWRSWCQPPIYKQIIQNVYKHCTIYTWILPVRSEMSAPKKHTQNSSFWAEIWRHFPPPKWLRHITETCLSGDL